jgi:hypothetical protein
MAHRSTFVLVLAMASLFVACDKGGVYPLGGDKDVIVQCDVQSTWLRSVEGATEVFVIGSNDLANLDAQLSDGEGVCFNFGRVEHNSTTQLSSGSLYARGGAFEVEIPAEYSFIYEPEKNIVLRTGARRTDLDPPVVIGDVSFAPDGDALILDYDGESRRLTRIGDVIARLNPDEPDPDAVGGAKDAYRLFNLALFVGQPRIPGFGGTGMTQYTTKTTFSSLISGQFTIEVASITTPHVSIDYLEAVELEGIMIHGLQVTRSNLSGEGPMEGILDVKLFTDPNPDYDGPADIDLAIDYADLVVGNGVADSGFYTVTINGTHVHELEYSLATDEDFHRSGEGILLISEGVP